MEAIFSWMKNIAFFLILSGLLLQLLPDGKYRKYLKFFSGMILVILVASPVNHWFGLEEQLVRAAEEFVWEQQAVEIQEQFILADEARYDQLQREYETLIAEQAGSVANAYGYEIEDCRAELVLDTESESFGQVSSLTVILRPEEEGQVIWVEPVQIGEVTAEAQKGGEPETEEQLTSAELPQIREELAEMYSLEGSELVVRLIE